MSGEPLDRRALARAFDRAAASYDAAAWLQTYAREELLERLSFFSLEAHVVVDLGAGTCRASEPLARRFPGARVLAVDLAAGMLAAAPRRRWRPRFTRLCADAHALPLAQGGTDLIYANLMLQWCTPAERLFTELARVLRPGGLLVFSTLGPDTLLELREAWMAADNGSHLNDFPDMPQLAAALTHGGFVEPVIDSEHVRHDYPDAYALMRELKRIGAHNVTQARARGLTSPARLRAMVEAYERRRGAKGLPATYQLLFGIAFRGSAARATAAGPAEQQVSLETLRALARRAPP